MFDDDGRTDPDGLRLRSEIRIEDNHDMNSVGILTRRRHCLSLCYSIAHTVIASLDRSLGLINRDLLSIFWMSLS
jgi:hypothetical protein